MLYWLTNPWIVTFVAPLIASALAVFVKWSSRNDRHARFAKEDCAVGLELAVAGIFALVVSTPLLAQGTSVKSSSSNSLATVEELAATMMMVFCFTIGLWIISTIVRKIGWIDEFTLHWVPGLLIPLVYGLAVLAWTAYWISSNVGGLE